MLRSDRLLLCSAVLTAAVCAAPGARADAPAKPADAPAKPADAPAKPADAPAKPADTPAKSASAPRPKSASSRLLSPDRRGAVVTWDLNLEGAAGWLPERGVVTGFGRVRGGLSLIINTDPLSPLRIWSLGAFYDVSNLSPATIGIQAESLSITSGTWTQFGGMFDVKTGAGGVMLAGGFSVFGLEVQRRFYDGEGGHGQVWALYGKLRIPVSIIALALSK